MIYLGYDCSVLSKDTKPTARLVCWMLGPDAALSLQALKDDCQSVLLPKRQGNTRILPAASLIRS